MKDNFLFQLIHLFGRQESTTSKLVDPVKHCAQNGHHDFYCDAERPYINKSN